MGLYQNIKKYFGFGYQAADYTPKRKAPATILRSEDDELYSWKRQALVATTRDLLRNYSVAKWAVNRHLDYISDFNFQARTGDDALDRRIESLVEWWSLPKNCDLCKRHNFKRIIRLLECRAVVDGDCLVIKMADGSLQVIEGDRIRTPYQLPPEYRDLDIINGVVLGKNGETTGYVICSRTNRTQFEFEQFIPVENTVFHGYWERFDQVRGISPLAAGLNSYKDVMEASEYALVKAKIVSLFGLKISRKEPDELPGTTDEDGNYSLDFSQGPFLLDMQPGDDASFLESSHPSTQFQDYMGTMIGVALKTLDIPQSFYQENYTSYSGARQAYIQYNQSADIKRQQLREVLNDLTEWKLRTWIAAGLLTLPNKMKIYDLNWEWVSKGVAWLNPLQEVNSNVTAINAGLTSRQRLCKERGEDWFEIINELEAEQNLMSAKGIQPKDTPIILDPSLILPDQLPQGNK